MAKLETICQRKVGTISEFDAMLLELWRAELITRNQWTELMKGVENWRVLPVEMIVTQRLAKSTTYLNATGKAVIKCNNRAKITVSYYTPFRA